MGAGLEQATATWDGGLTSEDIRACRPSSITAHRACPSNYPCPAYTQHTKLRPSPLYPRPRLAVVALLQAKVIASLGAQPEVLTLGHNPYKNEYIDAHLVLPTTRPKVRATKYRLHSKPASWLYGFS